MEDEAPIINNLIRFLLNGKTFKQLSIRFTMKQNIIFLGFFLLASTFFVSAQENKLRIAIFDPVISGSNFDEGTGVIIREMVSTVIVNSGKYHIIERSMIDKVLKEQNFSNSGAVDDNQISQIGKLAGANKVILSVLSSSGNRGLLSLKMIDVESANIERQKAQVVELSKILDIITPLALEVIGENSTTYVSNKENSGVSLTKSQNHTNTDIKQPANQINRKKTEQFTPNSNPETSGDDHIILFFEGYPSAKKNRTAQIYVDDKLVGTGNLHQGFYVNFPDNQPNGKYKVQITWLGQESDTYKIDTHEKKYFKFKYIKFLVGICLDLVIEK